MTDPAARFAIIPLEPGPAPAEAIVIGSMNQVMEYIPQSVARDEAMAEFERARLSAEEIKQAQAATTRMQIATFADAVNQLERRVLAAEAEREAQVRRDLEEAERKEAERVAAHMRSLPDADDPDTWSGPSHGGELSTIPPSHPADKEQLAASEDQGNLPPELLEGAPPPSGTAPTIGFEDARRSRARPYKTAPQTYPQVAVSLNEE
jgi:hypothetical protein